MTNANMCRDSRCNVFSIEEWKVCKIKVVKCVDAWRKCRAINGGIQRDFPKFYLCSGRGDGDSMGSLSY